MYSSIAEENNNDEYETLKFIGKDVEWKSDMDDLSSTIINIEEEMDSKEDEDERQCAMQTDSEIGSQHSGKRKSLIFKMITAVGILGSGAVVVWMRFTGSGKAFTEAYKAKCPHDAPTGWFAHPDAMDAYRYMAREADAGFHDAWKSLQKAWKNEGDEHVPEEVRKESIVCHNDEDNRSAQDEESATALKEAQTVVADQDLATATEPQAN